MTLRANSTGRAFLEATGELTQELESGDAVGLTARMARQVECFEALRAEANRGGTFHSPELAEGMAAAEEALALARKQLAEIRQELERVRHARASAALSRTNEPTARFISRRV